jgi:hypothetical protein
MFRKSHLTVLFIASAMILGACGKNSAKKGVTPSNAGLQPSSQTQSDLQGNWKSSCIPDGYFSSSPEIHTLVVNGNLLTESYVTYTDSACTQGASQPVSYSSHFTVAKISDPTYAESITYTDGDFNGLSEDYVINSSGLTFNDEPNAFTKQ